MDLLKIKEKFYNKQLEKDGVKVSVTQNFTRIDNVIGFFKEIEDYMQSRDTKYFFTNSILNQGDVIEFNNNKYLIIQKQENTNNSYYNKYVVILCNISFKLNFKGEIKEYFGKAKGNIFTINENVSSPVSFATGNINVLIPNIKGNVIDLRIIKWNEAFKIIGDDRTKTGLLNITLEKDILISSDDKENEIPNRWDYEKNYKYEFEVIPIEMTLQEGETKEIKINVKENDKTVEIPMNVKSDNDNIVVKNNNVTAVKSGNSIITISFIGKDKKEYSKNIKVNIKEKPLAPPVEKVEYKLTNNMGIKVKRFNTNTFVAHKLNNGEEIPTKFDFSIDYNGVSSSYLKLIIVDDKTAKIKNNKCTNGEKIYLIVKENDKEVIRQEIYLINMG